MSEDDFADQLIADDELRARFREDPVGVCREAGVELTDEQEAKLLAEDWIDKTEDELLALLRGGGIGIWW